MADSPRKPHPYPVTMRTAPLPIRLLLIDCRRRLWGPTQNFG